MENIPGIRLLGASALTIALGDSRDFTNGQRFASYLGLVSTTPPVAEGHYCSERCE
ncbi:transposase [Dickeya oryzae]|uniref:transposase n=1 Tax=Dickeya oryzae TaxID=1240404 RepID=UPI001FEDE74F|nr:transposase [Dickeya oryzae]